MTEHHHGPQDPENPHAGHGAVLLDIGGDVGALVVQMPPETAGLEVEILPAGTVGRDEPAHRPHGMVLNRPTPSGEVASLVFSSLAQGRYDLMPIGTDDVRLTATVVGGEVTMADWPV